MTQIKQEPCDYDETEESKQIATCIEIKDPLDIKLEPVLIKSEPVLDSDEKEESESESSEKIVISKPQNGTADVDLDNIDLILSDEDQNGKNYENEDNSAEDSKNEDLSEEDEDFSIPDVESPEEPETDEDVDVEGFDEIPPGDDPMDLNGSDGSDGSEEENETIEIEGLEIVQKGQYSKCPRCEKFIKSTFIIRHIKLHDAKEEKVTCPDGCELTFAKINNMFRHLKNVHKSKEPFVCKHCGKRFAKSKTLTTHLAKHRADKRRAQESAEEALENSGNGRFTCEFPGCDKSYGKKHHLREHERKHSGDMKFACEVCGKKFYMHAHMKRHMYSHTGLKPHVCRWKCGLTFASYGGRMKHERINHYKRNPLQSECDVCGRPFRNQQQLIKHRMTHLNPAERQEYRCSYCHIMFDTIKIRMRHEKRHQEGDNFACHECDRKFTNEKNLAHHMKHHHCAEKPEKPVKTKQQRKRNPKKDTTKDATIESDANGEKTEAVSASADKKSDANKMHPCHLCTPTKMFCLTSLRRHLARIHSTNFKCEKCGKGFQEESRYKAHMDIHRLRECHICGKVFARKQNADIHLIGLHKLNPAQLAELGRWNPRSQTDQCPEYMTRASHKSRAEIMRMEASEDIDIKEEPLDIIENIP